MICMTCDVHTVMSARTLLPTLNVNTAIPTGTNTFVIPVFFPKISGRRLPALFPAIAAVLLICLSPGCRTLSVPERHLEQMPEAARARTVTGNSASAGWWDAFDSKELDRLIRQALGRDFTLRQARARLEQARRRLKARTAESGPGVTLEGGITKTQTDHDATSGNTFSLGPSAAYEVDLWGRISAELSAESLTARAAAHDLEAAAMTVAATTARTWVDLLTARLKLDGITRQLAVGKTLLRLLELRFTKSMSSALDVLQQRETVARTAARIPPVKEEILKLTHALSLLLGEVPGAPLDITGHLPETLPPLPRQGLPANLLAMRPDVRAAGARLRAADWDFSAEKAGRLPDFFLSGTLLGRDGHLDLLLRNWTLTLAARLTGSLFDGGAQEARTAQARAVVDERLAAYESVVHTAILEVEDSLAAEHYQKKHLTLLTEQLEAARMALSEARRRYINGMDPFIPFLTEQLNVQELEISVLAQKAVRLKNRITLYRALGGDWRPLLPRLSKESE